MTNFKKTWKQRGALTACVLLTTLSLPGCVWLNGSQSAICEGTSAATDAHAETLLGADVPDEVVISGDLLIAQLDAACAR